MPRRPHPFSPCALAEIARLRRPHKSCTCDVCTAPAHEAPRPVPFREIARRLRAQRLTSSIVDPRVIWRAARRAGVAVVALLALATASTGCGDEGSFILRYHKPDGAALAPRPQVCTTAPADAGAELFQVRDHCGGRTLGGRRCFACEFSTTYAHPTPCAINEVIVCVASCEQCDPEGP